MSRRRRSRTTLVASSSEDEDAAPPPRAARRAALQLSQSTAGSGGTSSAGAALATLLAGSKPLGPSQLPAEPKPRRSGRAVTQSKAKAAAGGAGAKTAAARKAAAPAAQPSQAQGAAAAAAAAGHAGALWTDKHAPASEADLVVHKKKVQEVRDWLEEQRRSLGRPGVPRLLVVTGALVWLAGGAGLGGAQTAGPWGRVRIALCMRLDVHRCGLRSPSQARPAAASPPRSRAWRRPWALTSRSGARRRRWAGRRRSMRAWSAGARGGGGQLAAGRGDPPVGGLPAGACRVCCSCGACAACLLLRLLLLRPSRALWSSPPSRPHPCPCTPPLQDQGGGVWRVCGPLQDAPPVPAQQQQRRRARRRRRQRRGGQPSGGAAAP